MPLADLLPRQGNGQLVITTRDRQLGETLAAEPLVVDVFDPQTALELLRRRVPDLSIDDQKLATLAERVGFLPIAVDLVGYQLANGYGPAEVLAGLPEFNAARRDVTIGALWQNTLPRLNLPAQRLLELFSVLAPDRIPVGHLDSVEFDPPMDSPAMRWRRCSVGVSSSAFQPAAVPPFRFTACCRMWCAGGRRSWPVGTRTQRAC